MYVIFVVGAVEGVPTQNQVPAMLDLAIVQGVCRVQLTVPAPAVFTVASMAAQKAIKDREYFFIECASKK